MRKLILLILLLPLFVRAQAPTSDSTIFTAPPITNPFSPQFRYSGGNASNLRVQFFNSTTGKFSQLVTGYQFNQYIGTATQAAITAAGTGWVPTSRQIINGYGITGGHSLATDVTLAVDTGTIFGNLVHKTGTETIKGLKTFGNNSTWGSGNFVGTITSGYGNWYDNSGASTLQLTVRASSIQYNYGVTNSTGLNFTIPTHSNSISFPDASGTIALKTDTGYFRTVANSMSLAQLHSNYQPLNAKLTSISTLANSAGVLTNDGSGGFSYTTPGSGTMTAVSVSSSNGFAGSSSGGSTPSLTLSTTVTGIVKGNGTALSAAVSNTDYLPVTSPVMTGASTNNLSITGTSGTGFLNLGGTTSVAATPASGMTLFSRSTNRLSLLGANGFEALIGTTSFTVGHVISFPDASGFLMTNPLTTAGDIPYLSASSSTGTNVARLGIGSTNNVLIVSGGLPTWSAITPSNTDTTSTGFATRLLINNYLSKSGAISTYASLSNNNALIGIQRVGSGSFTGLNGQVQISGSNNQYSSIRSTNGFDAVNEYSDGTYTGYSGLLSSTQGAGIYGVYLNGATRFSIAQNGSATFNNTLGASNLSGTNTGDQTITLTGDAIGSGTGSFVTTLATVNSNVGSFGSSTSIPSFTVNAKGLITAVSGNSVIAPAGTLSGSALASGVTTSSLTSAAGGTFGTNAFNSTAYLPLAGGTVTGATNFNAAIYSGAPNSATKPGSWFGYSPNAASRSWVLINDQSVFGDFTLGQTTTQAGTAINPALYFDASRNATFSGTLGATGGLASGTTAVTPSGSTDVANKAYVDAATGGGYSEGSWTPNGTTGISYSTGSYIKIGNQVTAYFNIILNTSASTSDFVLSGLPFTSSSSTYGTVTFAYQNTGVTLTGETGISSTNVLIFNTAAVRQKDVDLSGKSLVGSVTYRTN